MSKAPTINAGFLRPGFVIGDIVIRESYGERDNVWLERPGGEGGDFPAAEIEALLIKYYEEHF